MRLRYLLVPCLTVLLSLPVVALANPIEYPGNDYSVYFDVILAEVLVVLLEFELLRRFLRVPALSALLASFLANIASIAAGIYADLVLNLRVDLINYIGSFQIDYLIAHPRDLPGYCYWLSEMIPLQPWTIEQLLLVLAMILLAVVVEAPIVYFMLRNKTKRRVLLIAALINVVSYPLFYLTLSAMAGDWASF